MLTLEVKFIPFTRKFSQNWGWYEDLEDAKKCALIAEEFAIGFAEWCTKYRELNSNVYGKTLYAKSKYDDVFLIEELLEIYKKEKGL